MTLVQPIPRDRIESPSGMPNERRRGLRVRQARPIKVLDASTARYFGGQTCDVSATGLRIELPARAAVCAGRIVSIHVGLSHAGEPLANRRRMIPARVVWVRQEPDASRATLTAGIEFVPSIAARLDAA